MSAEGLADLSRGFDAVKAAGGQLDAAAEPRLQTALGLDDAAFGALLLAVGAFALSRPGRFATFALLTVGLGVALTPLVIGIPSKVDAAVRVTKIGRVGLAPATGQKAVGATTLFDGMVTDVQTKLRPQLEQTMGPQGYATTFATLATFSDEWQRTTSAKSHALSNSQVALSSTFANADRIPLRPIPWLFILPGIALVLTAGGALAQSARRTAASVPVRVGSRTVPTA